MYTHIKQLSIMINLVELKDGDLQIVATDLAELSDWEYNCNVDDERGVLNMLLDDARYIGNDWHTPTDLGLTEVPAIAYGAIYDDEDGLPTDYEKLWYFDEYMICSFMDMLISQGQVVFKKYED